MKIIAGSSNEQLSFDIASNLHLTLTPREIFIFSDGERRIRLLDDVVDEHVVIVQATSTPVDTNFLELFFLADAAKRSGASKVTAVVPYFGYQRQDHVYRLGEAVSLEVMIKTMEAVSIDNIISFDFHSVKIPEVFTIPVTHLSAIPLFAKKIIDLKLGEGDTQLVTPDLGGVRRIKLISGLLNSMEYTCIVKERNVNTGKIKALGIRGDIKQRMLLVDDMISSGGTIAQAAKILRNNGAEEIYVFATHAILTDEAPKILQNSEVTKVFISDSVYVPGDKRFEKLEIISIADMIARSLQGE